MRPRAGHATTGQVTTGTGEIAVKGADGFARDWQELRADEAIQFAPLKLPEPAPTEPPPDWWLEFIEFLDRLLSPVGEFFAAIGGLLGMSGPVFFWLLVAIGIALAGLLIWRFAKAAVRRRGDKAEPEPDWTPDAGEALGLLEDADRLADEGRYDEATHLLLQRSVGQIAAARPGLLEPSSTAREIAALPALPEGVRGAFATIAERVERSLFALRRLSADDWRAARAAYADFALAVPQSGGGAL